MPEVTEVQQIKQLEVTVISELKECFGEAESPRALCFKDARQSRPDYVLQVPHSVFVEEVKLETKLVFLTFISSANVCCTEHFFSYMRCRAT